MAFFGRWKAGGKLSEHDAGVLEMETDCRILELASTYDQVHLSQCAWAEVLVRRVQIHQLRHRERFMDSMIFPGGGRQPGKGGGDGGGKKGKVVELNPEADYHLMLGVSQRPSFRCVRATCPRVHLE